MDNDTQPKFTDLPTTWTKEMIDKFNSAPFKCRTPDYAGDPVPPRTQEDKQLDAMFDNINDKLSYGEFAEVDHMLSQVNPDKMSVVLALGLLAVTLAGKGRLHCRDALVRRIENMLLSRPDTKDRMAQLLRGLR